MAEKHKKNKDGVRSDGVSHYPADAHDLQSYALAAEALARFPTPGLIRAGNPHDRLFVAALDGTGNDAIHDPEHATNVASIHKQLERARNPHIRAEYVEGPGTQHGVIDRVWDGARGHTYDERIEKMYKLFIEQARTWKLEDPEAQISVVDLGFSRGAEQAAGFARLVHERGIQDPSGAKYIYDAQGQIKSVEYTKPPFVAPGQVAQVAALFDPVGTGEPVNEKDRRLPPSVISGFQIIAEDERRGLFKSSHIIDPGMTADGRFLGVVVGGKHSDIGGSYHRDGLGVRSGNLVVNYLNSLSDKPFLERRPEPDDPRLNVVHRSEEGMLLYRWGDKVDRLQPEGHVDRLVPRAWGGQVADAYNAEPRDEVLSRRFEHRVVAADQPPPRLDLTTAPPVSQIDDLFERLHRACARPDDALSRQQTHEIANEFARSPYGQQMQREIRECSQRMDAQEQWAMQQRQMVEQAEQMEAPQRSHGRSL
ncbi:hypothetical protein J2X06_003322 [Lysobacter niastensis]|uniref:T6SS Phospholipase effector Tle1-like catalytic domain-containing protein n=1 Tax=Lysobacter niastensis TaxID=380629 RepID=A0ABU1WFD4_9GAMM|nr:DUF2235 domain-containing protein [Lysobacter niastensis]MDR7136104.1 hypothetical protein [Lysobacter niastensis]